MMGLHVLMDPRLPALGGFVGIVGELLNETRVRATWAKRRVPIRCFFAENDDCVLPAEGRKSLRRLKARGFDVAHMTIPGTHGSIAVEKYALLDFFHELIPSQAAPRKLFLDLIPEAARRRRDRMIPEI